MRRYCCPRTYFYPRPPRGGRQRLPVLPCFGKIFLSTPSARRATAPTNADAEGFVISIHALREEGDRAAGGLTDGLHNFYPRPPRGGRPTTRVLTGTGSLFLSTPSARRATAHVMTSLGSSSNFYPRPPRGGRLMGKAQCSSAKGFLSTPSARRATAKTETKSLFSNKLYNILHEFRRALIYNGSKSYPNHAK